MHFKKIAYSASPQNNPRAIPLGKQEYSVQDQSHGVVGRIKEEGI